MIDNICHELVAYIRDWIERFCIDNYCLHDFKVSCSYYDELINPKMNDTRIVIKIESFGKVIATMNHRLERLLANNLDDILLFSLGYLIKINVVTKQKEEEMLSEDADAQLIAITKKYQEKLKKANSSAN